MGDEDRASWQRRADQLAREGEAAGAPPDAWFERLYAEGDRGEVPLPWDKDEPSPWLVEWAERSDLSGVGRPAIVVGAGLGVEAGYIASRGFTTTAFDISPTAVRIASVRSPAVEFVVADVLDLPENWIGQFELVVEQFTVQALPVELRAQLVASIASLVAPGGTLLVIQSTRTEGEEVEGPPWPLTETEVRSFTAYGLDLIELEETSELIRGYPMWRAEYTRPT